MRAVGITFLSLALTTAVIGNAYYQKKQFYPSVVYITKSNPSMAVIYVQAFILVILMGKLMRKVFFGQLRAAEFEHLMERSWYAVTETCLAFTVFRDDFSPKFVALFTLLLFLKSFHWLAEDRVDYMERSPVISWLFHIRVLSLLAMLGALDLHFVGHAYQSTVTKGASVQLVFGFEYAILLTIIINICIKYALHTIDLNSENPWDNKAVFLLYTELVMGFFKVILYIAFVAIMVRIYTLPLFAFRPMYYTMRGFKKAFNDVILSRRAIHNMNTLYPDATQEELAAADNVCIICREEMMTASKKLPCNHIFHTSCLRSWFQRQQTCPTCRLNILRTPATPQPAHAAAPQQPAPHAPAAQQPPAPGAVPQIPAGINPFPPFPGPLPFWQMFQQPGAGQRPAEQQQQQPPPAGSAPSPSPGTSSAPGVAAGQVPPPPPPPGATTGTNMPFLCPPFPFMPFIPPPPMPPANFSGLSIEELRRMEGSTRESVEARLQCLRNIQLLLDASVTMMQQYATVVAATSRMAQPPPSSVSQPATAATMSPTIPVPAASMVPPTAPLTAATPVLPTTSVPSTSSIPPVASPTTATANAVATENTTAPVAEPSHKNVNNDRSDGSEDTATGEATPTSETDDQEELRRRRLQKFVQAVYEGTQ